MKHLAAIALRITFSTYIVYSSQTATFAKIGRSKSHPEWVYPVFLPGHVPSKKTKHWEWRRYLPAQPMRRPGHKRRPRLYVKAVKPVGGLPGGGNFPSCDPWVIFSFPVGWGCCCVVFQQLLVRVWVGPVTSAGCAVEAAVLLCWQAVGSFRLQDFTVVFYEAERMYCILLTAGKHCRFG